MVTTDKKMTPAVEADSRGSLLAGLWYVRC
jgi:hypothetical protein